MQVIDLTQPPGTDRVVYSGTMKECVAFVVDWGDPDRIYHRIEESNEPFKMELIATKEQFTFVQTALNYVIQTTMSSASDFGSIIDQIKENLKDYDFEQQA